MKMRSVALVGMLSLIAGISTQVHAKSITYTFSGALTDIRGGGAGIAWGTSFLGSYIYDDAPQVGSLIESGRQRYTGGQFGVSAGPTTLMESIASQLQVFNDWTSVIGGYDKDDGYFVSSRIYDTNGTELPPKIRLPRDGV